MLYVKIELYPGGNAKKRILKSQLAIVNDGTGNYQVGNYDVTLLRNKGDAGCVLGRVTNFPRQTGSPEALVILALSAIELGRVIDAEAEGSSQIRLDKNGGPCYNGPSK